MPDIIQLLPDHLANQIAAGEVIQRPASAVKELIENAIDAGADLIQLVLKDAGKELVQVIDNGKGMSPMDARMSFERHATSKIRKIEDLFQIRTMGFRGEALASVAAVAQVVLKSRQVGEEIGTNIVIESSEIQQQEPVACPVGTSIAVKNLFYNVPARRHFLKSNTTELRHIIDEFTRIALAYPEIAFRMSHNGTEQFRLEVGNLKTRIVGLLGNNIAKHLIPVQEVTDLVTIRGYIGKPEAATKTRGNQFFFINNRFIKSAYLNHAVTMAFSNLVAKETYPFYVLHLDIDPSKVDVNVHPTKQEVKFDEEKILYAYLNAAVTHALAKFNVAPAIDFTLNQDINDLEALKTTHSDASKTEVEKGYLFSQFSEKGKAHFIEKQDDMQKWKAQREQLFPAPAPYRASNYASGSLNSGNAISRIANTNREDLFGKEGAFAIPNASYDHEEKVPTTVGGLKENTVGGVLIELKEHSFAVANVVQWQQYIITSVKSGVLVIHQKRALERILYEQLSANGAQIINQQLLFPIYIEVNAGDSMILTEMLDDFRYLGYDIVKESDVDNNFIIKGVPADLPLGNEQDLIEAVIEQIKYDANVTKDLRRDKMVRTMVKRMAQPKKLQQEESQALIDELFACIQPQYSPDGGKVFNILSQNVIEAML